MLPVIYQSGYFTIKDFDEESRLYTLDFPNHEVKDGFLEVLLNKFVTVPNDDLGLAIANLSKALEIHDIDKGVDFETIAKTTPYSFLQN
jgi:hypothetical protein